MTKGKKDNWIVQFQGDFETLRRFLRPVSYGCFTPEEICTNLNIKPSRYRQLADLCRDVVPGDILDSEKDHHLQFSGSRAHSQNFLTTFYALKSLTQTDIYCYLVILSLLNKDKDRLSAAAIHNRCEDNPGYPSCVFNGKKKISYNTLKKHLQELCQLGLVKEVTLNGRKNKKYELADDPFSSLSRSEAQELQDAIDFYQHAALLSVPGCYLSRLLHYRYDLPERKLPCRFQNANFSRVLDEETAWQWLQAIHYQRKYYQAQDVFASCSYRKSPQEKLQKVFLGSPYALYTDDLGGGRQQLISMLPHPRHTRTSRRIDEIRDLKFGIFDRIQTGTRYAPKLPKQKTSHLQLVFHYPDETAKQKLQQRIREELPLAAPAFTTVDSSSFRCTLNAPKDFYHLLPLFRTFFPWIDILVSGKQRGIIKEKISAALKEYKTGVFIPDAPPAAAQKENPKESPMESRQNEFAQKSTLFQPTSNEVFLFLIKYWNLSGKQQEKQITRNELIKRFPFNGALHKEQSEHILDAAFNFEVQAKEDKNAKKYKNAALEVPPDTKIPYLPSLLERRWLKAFLCTSEARFLLQDALREKLLAGLSDEKAIDTACWLRSRSLFQGNALTEADIPCLHTIWHSLCREDRILLLLPDGTQLIPLSLCYDEITGRYSLLALNLETNTSRQLSLAEMRALTPGRTLITKRKLKSYTDRWLNSPENQKCCVQLQVKGSNTNARERCFAVFSGYDKDASHPEPELYALTIFFPHRLKEDVTRRILALGPAALVQDTDREYRGHQNLSQEIRSEIIQYLQQAEKLYAADGGQA